MSSDVVSEDVLSVLPYYQDLINGATNNVLQKLKLLSDSGNSYADYVLGSYYLFGQLPRYYDFNADIEIGYVEQNALHLINDEMGLYYFTNLLKIGKKIEIFQLKGLFDLFKIIEGKSLFFQKHKINCKPIDNNYSHLKPLFDSVQKIMDILVDLDHYEIYIDYAELKLNEALNNGESSFYNEAILYLNKIIDAQDYVSLRDLKKAYMLLGEIYLTGNAFQSPDYMKGIHFFELARCDAGYEKIIDFYAKHAETYASSIKRCVGLISDETLKENLRDKFGFEKPVKADIHDLLAKIFNKSFFIEDISNQIDDFQSQKDLERSLLAEQENIASEFSGLFDDLNESSSYNDSDDDIQPVNDIYIDEHEDDVDDLLDGPDFEPPDPDF